MDKIIKELSERFNELHKDFQSVQDLVNDIDFVFDYTEEEQWLFYRMRSTMEEHCGALLRLIRYLKKQELEEQEHHCGQDCDCDDACCQAGSPCGRSAVAYDPNESQPVDTKPAITGESLRNLMGMQVCRCNVPCDVCAIDKHVGACVKLELVGGDYICLAPTPNTVTK